MIPPYAREAGAIVLLAGLAFTHWLAYDYGRSESRTELAEHKAATAEQVAHAEGVVRRVEAEKAEAIAAIDRQHEQDKANAQIEHDRVVAGLRNRTIELRNHWQGCRATSAVIASASQRDEGARLREESAARIVQAADEADAQIRALQRIVEADRR